MTYKEILTKKMAELSQDEKVMFIGYNVKYGHRINGTLNKCREESLLEMPVAENLIMGVAMGLSLEGYRPVVCLERMDFLWSCADAIINHLDKAKELGWPPLNVIIRTCVGGCTPLDPGCQHKGDYTEIFQRILAAPVMAIKRAEDVNHVWDIAMKCTGPVMVVEYRELYNLEPTLPTVLSKSTEVDGAPGRLS